MRYFLLVISVVLAGRWSPASQKDLSGTFFSSQMAYHLAQLKTFSDFAENFKLTPGDQNLFAEDYKASSQGPLIPSFKVHDGKIIFDDSKKAFEFDFSNADRGSVFINGYKVGITKPIAYGAAKIIINDIEKKAPRKLAWWAEFFLPRAQAQTQDQTQIRAGTANNGSAAFSKSFYASFLSCVASAQADYFSETFPGDLKGDTQFQHAWYKVLDQTLIRTYQEQMEQAETYVKNPSRPQPLNFKTLTFKCEGPRLVSVNDQYLVKIGAPSKEIAWALDVNPSGYVYHDTMEKCSFTADVDGIEHPDPTSRCIVPYHENLFDRGPFYSFPKVAAQCCAKAGCYQKVSEALRAIANGGLTKTVTAPAHIN